MSIGRDLCCAPAPDPRGDAGAVFDEVKSAEVTALTARHSYCIRPRHSKAVDAEALAPQGSKPSSSDDGSGLSEDEQGRSRTSKHSRWSDLDEQRLLAYKEEGKS